jgi:hypothetical protein
MCGEPDQVGLSNVPFSADSLEDRTTLFFSRPTWSEKEMIAPGNIANSSFIGFGEITPKDKVLIAVTTHHDPEVVTLFSKILRKKGARVDTIIIDEGQDRLLDYLDEIKGDIRTESYKINPRLYDCRHDVLEFAVKNGYNALVHGRLFGPGLIMPATASIKWKPFQFQTKEQLMTQDADFPMPLHSLINHKAWNMIYKEGRNGHVKVRDPEGSEFDFTLHEEYYTRNDPYPAGFGPKPLLGHLYCHPTPPLINDADGFGVVAGTTSHFTRPFPTIELELESGRIERIHGGGGYGDAWREILEKTQNVQYPSDFPRKGLFWLWELALGTNPHRRRQSDVLRMRSQGNFWEVFRSGILHVGFGTRWYGPAEDWATSKGIPYGHLHVHLLFPTYDIEKGGKTIRVIENGRLTALDDPEVRDLAKKYGDPERLLKEEWVPKIPGISMDGKYSDYARDPADWISKFG